MSNRFEQTVLDAIAYADSHWERERARVEAWYQSHPECNYQLVELTTLGNAKRDESTTVDVAERWRPDWLTNQLKIEKLNAGKLPLIAPRAKPIVDAPRIDPETGEEWRDICAMGGAYQVSNRGRVRSMRGGVKLKPLIFVERFWAVSLSSFGNSRTYLVHRLVYEAFVGAILSNGHIKFIDGDTNNLRPDNLQMVGVVTDEIIRQIFALQGIMSQRQIGAQFGLSAATVGRILRGEMAVG